MLELLIKYPLQTFREASVSFETGWPLVLLLVVSGGLMVMFAVLLSSSDLSRAKICTLWMLQTVFAITVLLMLWQPSLQVEDLLSGENSVTLMIDGSGSMEHADGGARSRLVQVQEQIEQVNLHETLKEKFSTEAISFSTEVRKLDSLDSLEASGSRTDLLGKLKSTLERSRQKPVAGIVLISDGGNNSGQQNAEWWRELSSFQVPVISVGVGASVLPDDLELSSVTLPDSSGAGVDVPIRVEIKHDSGQQAKLKIYDGENLLRVDDLLLSDANSKTVHATSIESAAAGVMDLRFEIVSTNNESGLVNNTQRRILPINSDRRRVLYIEGEPRWEFKFIRRALQDFTGIEIVSLLRTSANKFYRQGVSSATELQSGFPENQAELFAYDAVIIGSLEAAHLNGEQQRFLRDFVRVRGGSLLMLAGKNGLADGGWGRSEIARALPAELDSATRSGNATLTREQTAATFIRERRTVSPSRLGEQTPWLLFDKTANANLAAWSGLPQIADIQRIGRTKPGASVLLEAFADDQSSTNGAPLLLWQRYGRGKSYMLATSGTWRWQMGLPSSDQRHEKFWQGFVGQMVSGVLPRLSVDLDKPNYADTSAVELNVVLRDSDFKPHQNAPLRATLTYPTGSQTELTLTQDTELRGHYRAGFEAPATGDYRIDVTTLEAEPVATSLWFVREEGRAEEFGIRRNDALLRRIATETGGHYLDLSELSRVPDLLQRSEALLVRNLTLPLWNMPLLFLLLLLSKLSEWGLRGRWGRI